MARDGAETDLLSRGDLSPTGYFLFGATSMETHANTTSKLITTTPPPPTGSTPQKAVDLAQTSTPGEARANFVD